MIVSIEKDDDLLPYTSSGCMKAWILFLVEGLENVHNTLILKTVLLPFSNWLYILAYIKLGQLASFMWCYSQTLQYFEQLKSSPDGWKICATDFTENLHR